MEPSFNALQLNEKGKKNTLEEFLNKKLINLINKVALIP